MFTSRVFQLIFLKETALLVFSLVCIWFSISLWVDSHYTVKNLQPHPGTVTRIARVIIKDKPLYKERELRVTLDTEKNSVFTLLPEDDMDSVASQVAIGDHITVFTKPKYMGIFGLKKSSAINHLTKDGKVIVNYQDYKKTSSGFFYLALAFAIILLIVYVVKLRKRLWWDFGGYKKYQGRV